MHGPIESEFDRVIRETPPSGKRRSWSDEKILTARVYLGMHFGTSETTKGKLLGTFRIFRDALDQSSQGDPVSTREVRQALINEGHLGKEWFRWDTKMGLLVQAYMLDRQAIDRALDFEVAKQTS